MTSTKLLMLDDPFIPSKAPAVSKRIPDVLASLRPLGLSILLPAPISGTPVNASIGLAQGPWPYDFYLSVTASARALHAPKAREEQLHRFVFNARKLETRYLVLAFAGADRR
ncbi:hypothetical protein [Rhizobium leguminosarum]|uniref:hypothetical protein n=1 Tax=Rhizobium leguminosarum TaxID=384 RepID=UPI00103027DD|nr:hypothetical protein [Rhizobium leguminosarum]TAX41523.1 hypothetical protein ELI05_22310 [Rhizobium leguminosarum]